MEKLQGRAIGKGMLKICQDWVEVLPGRYLPQVPVAMGEMNMTLKPVNFSGSVHLSLKQLNMPYCSEIHFLLL